MVSTDGDPYLFSVKHIARVLESSSRELRETAKLIGGRPDLLRRFNKLIRLWWLPIRPESQRQQLDGIANTPEPIGQEADFWT